MPATKTKNDVVAKMPKVEPVTISAPNMEIIKLPLRGIAPLVIHRFSEKAKQQMVKDQQGGGTTKSKRTREPKDFDALYKAAMYVSDEGWKGIPCAAFRNASIGACRLVGYKMTHAKLAVFIEADGYDATDGTPLVKIETGAAECWIAHARNQTGVTDIRARPMWKQWTATLTVRYDADMFTTQDVVNLVTRVGLQVGICEGRPNSKNSAGLGFGLFEVQND